MAAEGTHVRVWNDSFSAQAEGDGELVPERKHEAVLGAPFEAGTQSVTYAGTPPSLFAFRRNDVPCAAIDEPALLVLRDKKWVEKRLRERDPMPPHAFLGWDGGALFVDSQIPACGWATGGSVERLEGGRGTRFTYFATNGTSSHPTLGLDPTFMAWGGSSAEQTLTLVGTFGVRAAAEGLGSHDIVVMRRHAHEPFKATVVVRVLGTSSQSVRTKVREFGSAALLWPPPVRDDGTPASDALTEGGDEIAWKGHASSIFRIKDDKTTELRFRSPAEQDCYVQDATFAGEQVYALVVCPSSPTRLVRAVVDGTPQRIATPASTAGASCTPTQIIGWPASSLWVRAACGGTPELPDTEAVFRIGHAQTPLPAP